MTLDQANMELQLVGSTAYDDEVDGMYACMEEERQAYELYIQQHQAYDDYLESWDNYPADLIDGIKRSFESE